MLERASKDIAQFITPVIIKHKSIHYCKDKLYYSALADLYCMRDPLVEL